MCGALSAVQVGDTAGDDTWSCASEASDMQDHASNWVLDDLDPFGAYHIQIYLVLGDVSELLALNSMLEWLWRASSNGPRPKPRLKKPPNPRLTV